MVYKEITVDVWRKPNEEVRVIQEEAEGRALVVHVFDSVAPLDLSQKSVFVYIQKPDDKLIYAQAQVSGNTASIALTGQMMSAYGRTKLCELEVVGNRGQVLKITLPVLYIVKSAYHDAIESTNEFSVLTENLQKVQSAVQKAESAMQAAENANESAEQIAGKTEILERNITTAEAKRVETENLRCANEELRENAEASRKVEFSEWKDASITALETVASAAAEADQAAERANRAAEKMEGLQIPEIGQMISEIIEDEKGKNGGIAALDQEGKISPMPNASDVGAREASWLPTTIEIGAVSITEKGEANGIATLNSQGRLVQMPDAEDVGAHPNTWLPAVSEIGAVPNLLINSSFSINQRGQEVYTRTSGQHIYTVDRWMAYGCSSVAREANTSPAVTPYQLKIGLANPGQSTFLQPIENFEALTGSTISISFWIKADAEEQFNVIFGLDANPITAATTWKEFKIAIPSVQIGAFVTHGLCLQTVSNTPAATYYQFAAPQVVFGSATDQYHMPDPSLEMVRCRRYFYSLNSSKSRYAMVGQGYARWSDLTLVGVPVTLAVPMRIQAPIVTMSGTIGTMGLPNVINAISVESYYSTENIMRLRFKMNGELEANTCYEIAARNDADANITLDAEIYD